MGTVSEPSRQVPLVGEKDVVVVGAGSAGVMAAVGAGRSGVSTALVEREAGVGGAFNVGMIGHFGNRFRGRYGQDLIAGAPREMLERTLALGSHPFRDTEEALGSLSIFFRHELCGRVCLQMLQEAGVELWLLAHFSAIQPALAGGYDLFIETKGGRLALRAREVVDCSGEADVALALGAPMRIATDRSWGLMFEMGFVDLDRYRAYVAACPRHVPEWDAWLAGRLGMTPEAVAQDTYWREWLEGSGRAWPFRREIMRAVDAGDLCLMRDLAEGGRIRYGWDGFWPEPWHGVDVVTANVCMVTGLNPHDPRHTTVAEVAARTYAFEFVDFLRRYVPGFERASIRIMGGRTMPRGGAEIIGEALPDPENIRRGIVPRETICLAGDQGYGLPLGQFVPKGVDHLLVAGKCAANGYTIRASITCAAAGYSCGILAAMAAREGVTPMKLDVERRRAALQARGVLLEPGPPRPGVEGYVMPRLPGVPYWDTTEGKDRAKKLS